MEGVHSRQTDHAIRMQSLSCCKSTLPAPPPPPPPPPPPFYYFVGFCSYFWMDGLSRPRISTEDMSSDPRPSPRAAINIKIKKRGLAYAWKTWRRLNEGTDKFTGKTPHSPRLPSLDYLFRTEPKHTLTNDLQGAGTGSGTGSEGLGLT